MTDFHAIRPRFGQKIDPFAAGDISRDDREFFELGSNGTNGITNTSRVTMGCGDGHDIESAFHQCGDMGEECGAVERAVRLAGGADSGSADKAEF